ncbi:hypothetical protein NQ315_014695 [Exocentrus adspersus]|uniref:Uncharacterized protein n=1 Tax=Exocentrus adspersus TaxID=1586481 RepID=A0AAV8VR77_9CUCU|nr:hypothetical protein NQ315_014695 [Exocentrus adspersus]
MNDDISNTSNKIVEIFRKALTQLSFNSSRGDKERWLRYVSNNIRLFNKAVKHGNHNLGIRNKLQTNLAQLQHFKITVKNFFKERVDGNLKQKRSDRVRWEDITSAFKGRLCTGVIINLNHIDPLAFLKDSFFVFNTRINNILKSSNSLKVNTIFCAEFVIKKGSGGALNKIIGLEVNVNKYEIGLGASSYITLPQQITEKKAVINIKNNDHYCFAWSIVAALHPVEKNPQRVSKYPHYSSFRFIGSRVSLKIKAYKRFRIK